MHPSLQECQQEACKRLIKPISQFYKPLITDYEKFVVEINVLDMKRKY